MREGLTPRPVRMQSLPLDERGYPVPWFVAWKDGKPEFRAMDGEKWIRAVRDRLCWVCGAQLGVHKTFVAGPMCGINRTSAEPPSHLDCARWSAINCPFLSNPDQVRREGDGIGPVSQTAPGFALERNPGVTLLWTTKSYSIFDDGQGKYLLHMGNPVSIEWYCEGRAAKKGEILYSITTGMPALMSVAMTQEGAVQELLKMRDAFIVEHVEKIAA